ncbi:outer membrane protein [Sporomusaceae bacterium BoRhaA]|uniref:OmpH family outer membrane protein n=1 Tax=Pelorhabdus rhamnosifermentans TaxID=2772457 RepID=UPI001FE826F5|nr:OmpH family outer membrane protein [Pelorhabdus rhamnosifermentans]MBU2702128.1 outer membrane protein [Pelorhabdus rhamnosifermentans]
MVNAKRQGKGFMLAVLFLLGVAGIISYNTSPTYAAEQSSSAIGVVDYQFLVSQHPDMVVAQQTINEALGQAKNDFDAKSAKMSDPDKQAFYQQLQQGIEQKKQELLGPINDKVMAAVKSIAEAKGLAIIVDKNSVIYGGQDITDDVMKMIIPK